MNRVCEECGKVAKYARKNLNPESKIIFSIYYCGECADLKAKWPNNVWMEIED